MATLIPQSEALPGSWATVAARGGQGTSGKAQLWQRSGEHGFKGGGLYMVVGGHGGARGMADGHSEQHV